MVAPCEFSPLYLLYIMTCLYVSEALQRALWRQCIQMIVVSTGQLSLLLEFPRKSAGTIQRGILGNCFPGFLYWCSGCIPHVCVLEASSRGKSYSQDCLALLAETTTRPNDRSLPPQSWAAVHREDLASSACLSVPSSSFPVA